jgi:hypothetical protein
VASIEREIELAAGGADAVTSNIAASGRNAEWAHVIGNVIGKSKNASTSARNSSCVILSMYALCCSAGTDLPS